MKKETKEIKTYSIKVEALVPCSLVYTIKAETPEDALKVLDKTPPTHIQPHTQRKKMNKAVVFEKGYSTIKLTKSY
jgi:hypothetical protein